MAVAIQKIGLNNISEKAQDQLKDFFERMDTETFTEKFENNRADNQIVQLETLIKVS